MIDNVMYRIFKASILAMIVSMASLVSVKVLKEIRREVKDDGRNAE